MKISGVSKDQLEAALQAVNMRYAGNVIWKRLETLNGSQSRFNVTLRVVSSRGKGHKVSFSGVPYGRNPRNLAAACWHVHGSFCDHVLDIAPKAVIRVGRGIVAKISNGDKRAGNWQNFNVGSQAYPCQASECCECSTDAEYGY